MAISKYLSSGRQRILAVLSMALCVTNIVVARHLSPDEALSRLNASSMAKVSQSHNLQAGSQLKLLHSISTEETKDPVLYLFSQNNNRVMVIAANDCAPALLGYFDNVGNLAPNDTLPPNLENWLNEYALQIQYAEDNPGTMTATISDSSKPAIDYLVKTKWNQDEPYNLLCPEFGGLHCVTGCVATAFAQVMNYHKWPERGTGSHSYKINYSDAGLIEYSIDFSEIIFDWDAMLNEYDSNSSDRSKEAVATLMKACGYSVDMIYTTASSGAVTRYIVDAAHEYFEYSDKAFFAERNNYTSQQWTDLVYDQLSKGLPLIYSGRDGIWSNSNGHCFVCDGYDGNGYFHFNWGWGGYCDGYFLMSALSPYGVGIGGSSDGPKVKVETQFFTCIASHFF